MFAAGTNYFDYILQKCFGEEELPSTYLLPTSAAQISPMQDVTKLMFYFCGLQVSFLSWGVLQEKVMTQVSSLYNYDSLEHNRVAFRNTPMLTMKRVISKIPSF